MTRATWMTAAWLLVPVGATALPLGFQVEPVAVGIERLDALYDASGLEWRTTGRLGTGCAMTLGSYASLGFEIGVAAGGTDFGLLDATAVRLARTDLQLELRGRVPGTLHGFGLQLAAGGGRLALRYHPDRVVLAVDGSTYGVDLRPIDIWTHHVAAEVLHAMPWGTIGLRSVWRYYALDVESPSGATRQNARDVLLGMVLRVDLH